MSDVIPTRNVDPNDYYVDYFRALRDYLTNPSADNRRNVCAMAEKADWAVKGYWSKHENFQDSLAELMDRLVAGHPDEWNLLLDLLVNMPESLVEDMRQLAPPGLKPLTPTQRAQYEKLMRPARWRRSGVSFNDQMTGGHQ